MTIEAFWQAFCKESGTDVHTHYEAWAFGGAPDKLAELVLRGIKTGTASAAELYALDEEEPMPQVGDYSVVLNSRDEPVCIIRTAKVTVLPFEEVSAHHAYAEGEGDRSLSYWRQVHQEFFTQELVSYGRSFRMDMPVCCEEFELLYPTVH